LKTTYVDALPALVDPTTGRLHTSFNQTVAATGRLSSSDPNLQNIPVRTPEGRRIRAAFVAGPGRRLVSADYSQIELRLLAHLSEDPAFLAAFRAGGDIHRQTAAVIFGVAPSDVTPEQRARAKTINFATIYGQGPRALGLQLGISYDEAQHFIDGYFERFAGVRAFLDRTVAEARDRGYVETILGRRRYISELREKNHNTRMFGERVAKNSPLQGSAADLIKVAMIEARNALRDGALRAKLLVQVHDELVVEAPTEEVDRVAALVKSCMEGAARLRVPLVADVGSGTRREPAATTGGLQVAASARLHAHRAADGDRHHRDPDDDPDSAVRQHARKGVRGRDEVRSPQPGHGGGVVLLRLRDLRRDAGPDAFLQHHARRHRGGEPSHPGGLVWHRQQYPHGATVLLLRRQRHAGRRGDGGGPGRLQLGELERVPTPP
jgi:hypothetical protein